MSELVDFVVIVLTAGNVFMTIYNLILANQRTRYAKETLDGSIRYWGSWKERKKDVTKEVLKEISTELLDKELKRRKENEERRMDSKKKKDTD